MKKSNVFDLFFEVAWFATSRKASEARAPGAKGPAGNGDLKCGEFVYDRLIGFKGLKSLAMRFDETIVVRADIFVFDFH
jgi:hypothetical protein